MTHTGARVTVTEIESLYQIGVAGGGLSKQPAWLGIMAHAVAELPKGCQGKAANKLLATILRKAGVRVTSEVAVSPWSAHSVDFLIVSDEGKVGVEFGTGQAERVELDLLKLITLALQREINCACLILPQNVTRHSVMGKQKMQTAVENLAIMCSPLLTFIQKQSGLKDIVIIWYA